MAPALLIIHADATPSPDASVLAASLAGFAESRAATTASGAIDAAKLAQLEGDATAVIVLAPELAHPFALIRRLVGISANFGFLVVAEAGRETALRREATFGAAPGSRCVIVANQPEEIGRAAASLLATARQQQRLRTTLERVRMQAARAPAPDAPELRRLVASDRYLASVLANASDAIISLRANATVASWNHGAEALFGLSSQAAAGQRLATLFESPAAFVDAFSAAWAGDAATASLSIARAGGIVHVEAKLDRINDDIGADRHVAVILRDVTAFRQNQEALRESGRQKDTFLTMLAHELRNPLAPIRNAAELLQLPGLQEAQSRRATDIIRRQVDHMSALIDDLLDVARVTRGAFVLDQQPARVDAIVQEAVEQARPLIDARRHRLSLKEDGTELLVLGDRKRLTQVVANLLTNAAKYTPDGGAIEVAVRHTQAEIEIAVTDNGIGIDDELLPHIFELFMQGNRSLDRAQGGLGVGLSLARILTRQHGGDVHASSAGAGLGSTFALVLPRHLPSSEDGVDPKASGAAPSGPGAALDVVVVDDNADAAATLAELLKALGHRVDSFTDPRRALERFNAKLPSAAFLDIGMPHIDGRQLARAIRALDGSANTTLVAVTGYGGPGDAELSRAAGFDAHVLKPIDVPLLTTMLEQASRRALHDEP